MVTKLIPLYNLNTTVFILAWQKKILERILNNRKVFKRNKINTTRNWYELVSYKNGIKIYNKAFSLAFDSINCILHFILQIYVHG